MLNDLKKRFKNASNYASGCMENAYHKYFWFRAIHKELQKIDDDKVRKKVIDTVFDIDKKQNVTLRPFDLNNVSKELFEIIVLAKIQNGKMYMDPINKIQRIYEIATKPKYIAKEDLYLHRYNHQKEKE